MTDRLADEHSRLKELELEEQAVRASFAVSYNELASEEKELFCSLAALPGPDFSQCTGGWRNQQRYERNRATAG